MSKTRTEKRVVNFHAKKLHELFVCYVFASHNKGRRERKDAFALYNSQWLQYCRLKSCTVKVVDFNVNGFRDMVSNKDSISEVKVRLGLVDKRKTFWQKLFG